jgi:hypothetical protein
MRSFSCGSSLASGLALTRLEIPDFWVRYIAIGGVRAMLELQAYLNDQVEWPAIEHDTAAHALNEHCAELGYGFPVAYAHELNPVSGLDQADA